MLGEHLGDKPAAEAALATLGLEPTRRAETLTAAEWLDLAALVVK